MEWYNTLAIIITAIAGIAIGIWTKGKILVKELREAFETLEKAMEDNSITTDELRSIVKEFVDVAKIFLMKK